MTRNNDGVHLGINFGYQTGSADDMNPVVTASWNFIPKENPRQRDIHLV
jgi:hypothetical protein